MSASCGEQGGPAKTGSWLRVQLGRGAPQGSAREYLPLEGHVGEQTKDHGGQEGTVDGNNAA